MIRFTFLLALLACAACKRGATQPTAGAAPDMTAEQVMFGLHQRVTTNGVRKAELRSDTATTQPNNPKIQLKGVHLTFFDENGKQTGEITSRTGEYDPMSGSMTARGKAVLVLQGSKGPRTLRTEQLHYDERANRVWSEQATSMEEAGQTYRGSSFESDTHFQNVTVKQLSTSNIRTGGAGLTF